MKKGIAAFFQMSDAVWLRHANPLSAWTRLPIGPLLVLAIWSRIWIGWWCLLPIALLVLWTWLNPRAFSPPRHFDNYMSRAVLGERDWVKIPPDELPAGLKLRANLGNFIAGLGLVALIWGLIVLDPGYTLAGLMVSLAGKFWFLHQMVGFYDRHGHKEHA